MRQFLLVFCLVFGSVAATCPSDATGLQSFQTLYPNPSTTTDVSITAPTLLDVTSLDVNTIVISGDGKLIFNPGSDITIRTRSIRVKDNAELVIGSEDCRFEDKVDIALYGTRTRDRTQISERGEKSITVEDNGSLKIYGKDKLSWTKLRTTVDIPSPIYKHSADPAVNEQQIWCDGLAAEVFDSSLTRVAFAAFDFWKNRAAKEQREVDNMVEALNNIADGQVVAIALQNFIRVSDGVDLSVLYSTIETVAGMPTNSLALRTSGRYDAFALVFQRGGTYAQTVDAQVAKTDTFALASIEAYGKKVTATSLIQPGVRWRSFVDFTVNSLTAGYPVLDLVHDVEDIWEQGDEVMIASTDYAWNHAEVRKIKSFPSVNQIELDNELLYRHFGEIEHDVDMRAEVALLSRNIKIHGEMTPGGCPPENENCGQFKYDSYGCHIKIIRSFAFAHIEGAEVFHCGQPTDKGFYPIHFHLCENVTNKEAVIRRNSIHDTFQRAITVHGTYGTSETALGVEVIENVAYNVLGHAYFLEDGAEKATALIGNLAASVLRIKNGFFSTDAKKVTAYWITTPETIFVNNSAAGSEGFGIWYVFPNKPVGPSVDMGVYQENEARRTPLWRNDNNVAHSNDLGGLNFDNILQNEDGDVAGCMRYNPLSNPLVRRSESSPVFIYRLTAYKNRAINLWIRGGGFSVFQCSLAESRRAVQLANGGPQHQYLTHCVIMGQSEGNHEQIEGYPDAFGKQGNGAEEFDHYLGIVFYDGPVWYSDLFLVGFKDQDNTIVAGAIAFFPKNKFSTSIVSSTRNVRFGGDDVTEQNWVYDGNREEDGLNGFGEFDGDELATFRDSDGSVVRCDNTPTPGTAYQIYKPRRFVKTDRTKYRANWKMAYSTDMYGKIRIDTLDAPEDMDPSSHMRRINRTDPSDMVYAEIDGDHSMEYITVLNRTDDYVYEFQYATAFPNKVKLVGRGVARDDDIIVGVCLPEGTTKEDITVLTATPDDFFLNNEGSGIIWVDDMDTLAQDSTMSRLFIQDRFLYVHLTNRLVRNPAWDAYDDDHCPGGWCPSLTVTMNEGAPSSYTPCFNPTADELLDVDIVIENVEDCAMSKGVKDETWGAGDTFASEDGEWREWGSWSECCNADAANPVQTTRTRTCSYPTPYGDGAPCVGEASETKDCPIGCPVDGTLSEWTRWSDCACLAGTTGVRSRTRQCTGTANGGEYCTGSSSETNSCRGDC